MLRKFLVTFLDGLEKLHRAQGAIFLITGPYLYYVVHTYGTLLYDPTSSRKHPRTSGDQLAHLHDLNSRSSSPNSHPIPTHAYA